MVGPAAVLLSMVALGLIMVLPIVFLAGFDPTDQRRHRSRGKLRADSQPSPDNPGPPGPAGNFPDCHTGVRPRPARGEPIEKLSADLRRLRGRICTNDHLSATHQIALRKAYDQVLIDTCELLEVGHELDQQTAGSERDLERLRVEAELEGRGIVLSRPPSGHTT